jgi:hypothetical protein
MYTRNGHPRVFNAFLTNGSATVTRERPRISDEGAAANQKFLYRAESGLVKYLRQRINHT